MEKNKEEEQKGCGRGSPSSAELREAGVSPVRRSDLQSKLKPTQSLAKLDLPGKRVCIFTPLVWPTSQSTRGKSGHHAPLPAETALHSTAQHRNSCSDRNPTGTSANAVLGTLAALRQTGSSGRAVARYRDHARPPNHASKRLCWIFAASLAPKALAASRLLRLLFSFHGSWSCFLRQADRTPASPDNTPLFALH